MKVDRVSYRETVSFGNYQNLSVEFSAAIGEGENPENAARSLAARARAEANRLAEEAERAMEAENRRCHDRDAAERDLADINRDIEVAKGRWERISEFLAKHGVDVSDLEIPF